jgi:hypothetical protein
MVTIPASWHKARALGAGRRRTRELFLALAWPGRISHAREVLLQKIVQGFPQILRLWNPSGVRQLGKRGDLVGLIVRHDLDLLADFHDLTMPYLDRRCHTSLQKYIVYWPNERDNQAAPGDVGAPPSA